MSGPVEVARISDPLMEHSVYIVWRSEGYVGLEWVSDEREVYVIDGRRETLCDGWTTWFGPEQVDALTDAFRKALA